MDCEGKLCFLFVSVIYYLMCTYPNNPLLLFIQLENDLLGHIDSDRFG